MAHFMAGFTAFRKKKIVESCEECLISLKKPRKDAGSGDKFTAMKERFGEYTYPSDSLVALIKAMEQAVGDCVAHHEVHKDMLFTTMKYLKVDISCFVECLDHQHSFKKKVMKYYLVTRMFFASEMKNKEIEAEKEKKQAFRKQSKL